MAQAEHFDAPVLGSGPGGILLAWHLARSGQRVAVVERRYVGGSCPNIACMPSKNEVWAARIAYQAPARGGVRHNHRPGHDRHGEGAPAQARYGR